MHKKRGLINFVHLYFSRGVDLMEWIERLNDAIKYIEDNLLDEIDYEIAAEKACCSLYHFQRMFSYISGIPLSEYIRRRKMSLAAIDIVNGEKIIDTALKYGYLSPTAFNRAFKSVHGIAPSQAKLSGAALKSYPPITFKITIKGADEMNFKIEKKNAFRIIGKSVPMAKEIEKNFAEIPSFWGRVTSDGTINKLCNVMNNDINGILGVSVCKEGDWKYFIAAVSDSHIDGFEEHIVPAHTWAVFSGSGQCPKAIQELEKRIFTEWFPSSGYEYDEGPDIELYLTPDPSAAKFEVWIPIKNKP